MFVNENDKVVTEHNVEAWHWGLSQLYEISHHEKVLNTKTQHQQELISERSVAF